MDLQTIKNYDISEKEMQIAVADYFSDKIGVTIEPSYITFSACADMDIECSDFSAHLKIVENEKGI